MGELVESVGYEVLVEFHLSYIDIWSDIKDYPVFIRLVESLCTRERRCLGWIFLPLIEFTYNNSSHLSIEMTLFEELYGRRCKTPLCWYESGQSVVIRSEIIQ